MINLFVQEEYVQVDGIRMNYIKVGTGHHAVPFVPDGFGECNTMTN